jgi:hypothetical protein
MPKKLDRIEVAQEGDERFLIKTFTDGSEERQPIVKLPRKKRCRPKADWSRKLSSGLKRGL